MYGLYIHIPFCASKCKYCDFYSLSGRQDIAGAYIDALCKRIKQIGKVEIDTIYIGGGTPTVLPPYLMEKLLSCIHEVYDMDKVVEFTVEANPNSASSEILKVLKSAGVNRISLGVQSMNDKELAALGRTHSKQDIVQATGLIKDAGFDNISMDLIYGLPGQTLADFQFSLEETLRLNPEHLSCYALKIEPGTVLYHDYISGAIRLPDEDEIAGMYHHAVDFLAQNGYFRYEISNFSKPKKESKHNIKYWKMEQYIGIGTSAASFDGKMRYKESSDLFTYIKSMETGADVTTDKTILSDQDFIQEYIFLSLRTDSGIDLCEFNKKFGYSFYESNKLTIDKLLSAGYMIRNGNFLSLTTKGMLVSNSIIVELI